jgi:iron-sulfur cluster assembly protein
MASTSPSQIRKALTLTDAAAARIKTLIERSDKPVLGLRVGVSNKGCSGMSYSIEYVTEEKPFEDKVEDKGVCLYIDPMALMFIVGSEMDYREDKLQAGFVFENPNATAQCGCGESFTVNQDAAQIS